MHLPELTPDVNWSVCLRDAETSDVLAERDPLAVLRTASVGKILLLVEVAAQAESGALDLDEELNWTGEDAVADSGLWYLMRRRSFAIDDLCWLVGGVSDNLATNVVLRRVGLATIYVRTKTLGFERSELLDRVRDDRGPDDPPTLSRGRAGELSDLMARLRRGEIVSPAVSGRVLRWLAANTDLSMTASAFGLDPLAHAEPDRDITLVNKTGTISTARADVGIVTGPHAAVAYAVLADWDGDRDPRDRVLADMAVIGDLVRAHVTGG
ncbi:MAG: serine hydrolase [Aeromicrobium sp.]